MSSVPLPNLRPLRSCGALCGFPDASAPDATVRVAVLIGLPLLFAWMMLRRYRGQSAANTPVFVVVVVAAVAWTIVRNLPGFPLVPTVLTG